jgi:hypothetical protein
MFLIGRQRSIARDTTGRKTLRRVKSGLLPLETCPLEEMLQELEQAVTMDLDRWDEMVGKMIEIDSYVLSGTCEAGLPGDLGEAVGIQIRLRRVFARWSERELGTRYELELDLKAVMKGKSNA